MGIKNIKVLINKYSPQSIRKINLKELTGKTIAIDVSIYLYKYKYGNNNNEVKYFLTSFLKQIKHLKEFNITPIYVFDGKPPEQKSSIITDRKNIKRQKYERVEELEKKINSVNDIIKTSEKNKDVYINNIKEMKKEMNKINMSIISVNKNDIEALKKLFLLTGIDYYQANTEAEIICSRLVKYKIADGVFSNDTDVLPNGCNKLYTDYDFNKDYIIEIDLESILKNTNLTLEQFVDICILCGCDYTIKIKTIGPINAYKLICKYKNIEYLLENIKDNKKYSITDDFISNFNYKEARSLFKSDHSIELNKKCDLNKIELIKFIKGNNIKFDIRQILHNTP